eukprot:663149_1
MEIIDNSTSKCKQCKSYVKIIKYFRQRVQELEMEQQTLRDALKLEQRNWNLLQRAYRLQQRKRNTNIPTTDYLIFRNKRKELFGDVTALSPSNLIEAKTATDNEPNMSTTHIQQTYADATEPMLGLEHCSTIDACPVFLKLKQTVHSFGKITQHYDSNVSLLNDFLHLTQQHHHKEQFVFEKEEKEYRNILHHSLSKMHRFYYGSIQKDRIANRYCEINILQNKPMDVTDNDEDDDGMPSSYSLGYKFAYVGKPERPRPRDCVWIKAKYETLKFELLNNDLAPLNLEQFDQEYGKAIALLNTFHCKQKYRKIDVAIENILSLMTYCNFDTLQREFS